MAQISKQKIEHVAQLARLKLTEPEEEKMTQEIGEILNYVEELDRADTGATDEKIYVTSLKNVMREDKITNQNNREKLLANAPMQQNGAIKVKKVFE